MMSLLGVVYILGSITALCLAIAEYRGTITRASELTHRFTGSRKYRVPPQAALDRARSQLTYNETIWQDYIDLASNSRDDAAFRACNRATDLREDILELEEEVKQRQVERHRASWLIVASPAWPVYLLILLLRWLRTGTRSLFSWVIHWPFWSDLMNRGGEPLWFTRWADHRKRMKEEKRRQLEAAKMAQEREATYLNGLAADMGLEVEDMIKAATDYVARNAH